MKLTSMRKIVFTVLICVAFAANAYGQGRVISQAYEVMLDDFQAPASPAGNVIFRSCEECERVSVRVTATTKYSINGKTVRLEDFRVAVLQTNDRDNKSVTVLHHLESNSVESIDAWL